MIAVIILALWIGVALLVAWVWHRFHQIDREWAALEDDDGIDEKKEGGE